MRNAKDILQLTIPRQKAWIHKETASDVSGTNVVSSVFPLKRAPHAKWNNEIERAELFLLFPLAFSEKGKFSFTALTIPPKLI